MNANVLTVAFVAVLTLSFHGTEILGFVVPPSTRNLQTCGIKYNGCRSNGGQVQRPEQRKPRDLRLLSVITPPEQNYERKDDDLEASNQYRRKLDGDFANIALPAFVGLAAEPIVSLLDGMWVGRLGASDQAGMGIALGAQYSVAKLYNDPLLKTSTSLVAGKEGTELSASVSTAIFTAALIGIMQSLCYLGFAGPILGIMNVLPGSEMRQPALIYLKWRAIGVPAATLLMVTNGIFRGRGDTKTPLYCSMLGHAVNIALDPILIFKFGMGVAGAGAANAIAQWVAALPTLYLLNKSIPIQLFGQEKGFFRKALQSYVKAGGMIFLRTIAKISTYTITSAAAAGLGTVPMAAYSLTFNLGFTASQLCEAISIASQALLARDIPFDDDKKKFAAAHVIRRTLLSGMAVSASLALTTLFNLDKVLGKMTKTPEIRIAAREVMPIVLLAQVLKGISSSTGGMLLGGCDWTYNAQSMGVSSAVAIAMVYLTHNSLASIWTALSVFMAAQFIAAALRITSGQGPWEGLTFRKDCTITACSIKESDRNRSPGFRHRIRQLFA
jgi:putative MATE family efflux protein